MKLSHCPHFAGQRGLVAAVGRGGYRGWRYERVDRGGLRDPPPPCHAKGDRRAMGARIRAPSADGTRARNDTHHDSATLAS